MQKVIFIFINLAGAFLLTFASALVLINWINPIDLVSPHDPIFLMSLDRIFWIISGIVIVVALICLFIQNSPIPIIVVFWLTLSFLVLRAGLFWEGCHNLTGFLGGFSFAFGVSAHTAGLVIDLMFIYLFGGSCFALSVMHRLPPLRQFEKIHCPSCGVHVKFDLENLGQKIPCPLCKKALILSKPENLKISCFFCREHVEFPSHAVGEKAICPHCHMGITLKEAA